MSRVLDQEVDESVASRMATGVKRRRAEDDASVSMGMSMAEHQQIQQEDEAAAELAIQEIDKLAEHGIGAAEVKK